MGLDFSRPSEELHRRLRTRVLDNGTRQLWKEVEVSEGTRVLVWREVVTRPMSSAPH